MVCCDACGPGFDGVVAVLWVPLRSQLWRVSESVLPCTWVGLDVGVEVFREVRISVAHSCDGTVELTLESPPTQFGFLCDVSPSARGHVSPQAQGSGYTTRAISQNWTGVRQYGQIFMLAVQRSHAS